MSYLDLLNLRSQLLQGAMAVYPVRDVIPKAVAHHPFPVCFPDTVALTQPTEGMPTGVLRSLRKPQSPQCALHIPPEL